MPLPYHPARPRHAIQPIKARFKFRENRGAEWLLPQCNRAVDALFAFLLKTSLGLPHRRRKNGEQYVAIVRLAERVLQCFKPFARRLRTSRPSPRSARARTAAVCRRCENREAPACRDGRDRRPALRPHADASAPRVPRCRGGRLRLAGRRVRASRQLRDETHAPQPLAGAARRESCVFEQFVHERTRGVQLAGIRAAFQQLLNDRRVSRGIGRRRRALDAPQEPRMRVEIGHVLEERPKPPSVGPHVVQTFFARLGDEAPTRSFQRAPFVTYRLLQPLDSQRAGVRRGYFRRPPRIVRST